MNRVRIAGASCLLGIWLVGVIASPWALAQEAQDEPAGSEAGKAGTIRGADQLRLDQPEEAAAAPRPIELLKESEAPDLLDSDLMTRTLQAEEAKEREAPVSKNLLEAEKASADLELEFEFLETQVESATLMEQSIAKAPSIVSVLNEEYFRTMGLRTLGDVLQRLPGVTVMDTQTGYHQVSVRGISDASSILLILDGQPLNSFYDGHFLSDLPLSSIERVELVRGPGSALYGTSALSGVITLYPKRRPELLEAGLTGEALVDDGVGTSGSPYLAYGQRFGSFQVNGFASYFRSTGPQIEVTEDISADMPYTYLPGYTNNHQELLTLQVGLEKEGVFSAKDELRISSLLLHKHHGPYFGLQKVYTPNSEFVHTISTSFADYRLPLGERMTLRGRLSFDLQGIENRVEEQPAGFVNDDDRDQEVDEGELFPEGQRRETTHQTNRLAAKLSLQHETASLPWVGANHLLIGLELEYDWLPEFVYGQNYESGLYRPGALGNYDELPFRQLDRNRSVVAGFVQDQVELLPSLWLLLALRYDHYNDFGDTLNPRAALVWEALPGITFKGLYGRAFRAPTFQELYDHTSLTTTNFAIHGSEDLSPVTTDTVELAADATLVRGLTVRLSGFLADTKDNIEIDTTYNASGHWYVNFPGRRIWGVESELQYLHPASRTYFGANLTWFSAAQTGTGIPGWEENNDKKFVKKELTDLPRLRVNAMCSVEPISPLRLGLYYSLVGESENNKRFIWESRWTRFEGEAFHELGATLNVSLLRKKLGLTLGVKTAFGKSIPISLSSRVYQLPAPSLDLFAAVNLYL